MREPFEIYKETTPADALDAMARILGEGGAPRSISGLHYIGSEQMFGQAVTLRSLPAREDLAKDTNENAQKKHGMDLLSYAISQCDEKSVLVIEARGTPHYAAAGGTGLSAVFARRAAGILVDGMLRDRTSLSDNSQKYGTKIVTSGFTAQYGTGRMLSPSEVNVPIAIGHSLVRPNDYIFANEDAVLVIPASHAEEILETAVIISRQAEVMEDKILDIQGLAGVDVLSNDEDIKSEMLKRFNFSERQEELWVKHAGRIL
ncbi:MAG: hypothetical protein OQK51_17625 [Kangiellaceae bacterium]|nr:hypothetical protein [Kangiellaceae bacterium]